MRKLVSIYGQPIVEFEVFSLLTKALRFFGRKIRMTCINDPAVVESGTELLIMNGLQLLDLPQRRFQFTIRQSLNNSWQHCMHNFMKHTIILLLASFATLHSASADNTKAGQSIMVIQGMRAPQLLGIYEKISGHEFIVDSHAKAVSLPITLKIINSPPKSREETLKQMRQAFLTQAGLVITQFDTNQESVTYNDALPLAITIDYRGVPDSTIIDIYQQLTGLELTRDSSAR